MEKMSENLVQESEPQGRIEREIATHGLEVPKLSFHFFFNSHSTREVGVEVGNKLKNADILIQENVGPDEERRAVYAEVSAGTLSPEEALSREAERGRPFLWPEFNQAVFEGLYKTNKGVVLADIPEESLMYQKLFALFRSDGAYNNLVDKAISYTEAVRRAGIITKVESDLQKEREDYILKQLPEELGEYLKQNPELAQKKELQILFSMGSFHTRLYHEMKNEGDTVTREFETAPYQYSPRTAIERHVHFHGAESSENLMPRLILYGLLAKVLPQNEITTDMLSLFSEEKIASLYEVYRTGTQEEFEQAFQDILSA